MPAPSGETITHCFGDTYFKWSARKIRDQQTRSSGVRQRRRTLSSLGHAYEQRQSRESVLDVHIVLGHERVLAVQHTGSRDRLHKGQIGRGHVGKGVAGKPLPNSEPDP